MTRLINHARRNAVAYVALFVALGGTGYAAVNLPRASVGARQLKNHAIAPVKLNNNFITGSVRAWALVDSNGQLLGGGGQPQVNASVFPGNYDITWGVNLGRACVTVATIDINHSPATESIPIPGNPAQPTTAGYAVAGSTQAGRGRHNNLTDIRTYDQSGQFKALGFDVAVIC